MRPRVEWMTRADDKFLELLDEADMALNPAVLSFNADYNPSYTSRRLSKLDDNGLVDRVGGDKAMYKITDLGREYLRGEIDATDLENGE